MLKEEMTAVDNLGTWMVAVVAMVCVLAMIPGLSGSNYSPPNVAFAPPPHVDPLVTVHND